MESCHCSLLCRRRAIAAQVGLDHIATAQHCIANRLVTNLKVVVGVTSLKEIDAELIFGVSKAIKHPDYHKFLLWKGHDIAILKLSKRIKFKAGQIEPACIKHQTLPLKEPLMLAGFGATSTVYVSSAL